jgi:hypothetical protein
MMDYYMFDRISEFTHVPKEYGDYVSRLGARYNGNSEVCITRTGRQLACTLRRMIARRKRKKGVK